MGQFVNPKYVRAIGQLSPLEAIRLNSGGTDFEAFTPASGSPSTVVDVASFATGGDGTSGDPWTGWDTEVTWGTANTEYHFRSGHFAHSTEFNFLGASPSGAALQMALTGEAGTILHFTGTGQAFVVSQPFVDINSEETKAVRVENFKVIGNANCTNLFYFNGLRNSEFRNLVGVECTGVGFRICAGICLAFYDIRCSFKEATGGAFTTVPAKGITLDDDDVVGSPSTTCNFFNTVIEGVSDKALYVINAQNCTFTGGTFEKGNGASAKGIVLAAGDASLGMTFIGIDAETNQGGDVESNSNACFIGCVFGGVFSVPAGIATATNCFFNSAPVLDGTLNAFNCQFGQDPTDNQTRTSKSSFAYSTGLWNRIGPYGLQCDETAPSAGAFTPAMYLGAEMTFTLSAATTINAPSGTFNAKYGPQHGQIVVMRIAQDATGGRVLTWDAIYKGAIPANSLTPDAVDYYCWQYTRFFVPSAGDFVPAMNLLWAKIADSQTQKEAALESAFTKTNATLANTNLSCTVFAGRSYRIEGYLIVSNSTAGEGAKFDFDGGTATATTFDVAFNAKGTVVVGNEVSAALATDLNYTSVTGTARVFVSGYLEVNAGGTFVLRASEDTTAAGTMTLAAGSWIALYETTDK